MRYVLFDTGERELKLRMNIEHTLVLERYKGITPYNFITQVYENKFDEEITMYILKEALAPYTDDYNSIELVGALVDEYFNNGGSWWTLNNILLLVFQEAGFYDRPESVDDKNDDEKVSSEDVTIHDIVKHMMEICLEAGLDEDDFWEMTYKEISNYIVAFRKRKETEFKNALIINHALGDLIGISVGRLFSKDANYPSVIELYPNVFVEEQEELKEQKQKELNERIKANMIAFGMAYKNNNELKEIYGEELK